jgi:hypothetical protein
MELDLSRDAAKRLAYLAYEGSGVGAHIVGILHKNLGKDNFRDSMVILDHCYGLIEHFFLRKIFEEFPGLEDEINEEVRERAAKAMKER